MFNLLSFLLFSLLETFFDLLIFLFKLIDLLSIGFLSLINFSFHLRLLLIELSFSTHIYCLGRYNLGAKFLKLYTLCFIFFISLYLGRQNIVHLFADDRFLPHSLGLHISHHFILILLGLALNLSDLLLGLCDLGLEFLMLPGNTCLLAVFDL